jgi:putative protease
MGSSTDRKSVEIAAPAGNLEKLKFAVYYGADSVYFGGEAFNLRAQSGNFSLAEIEEAIRFCRKHSVKTTFLLNSFLHENDIEAARRYIREIRGLPLDTIMISDPGMLLLLREEGIERDLSLSTQMSTLNHLSVNFWKSLGIRRIVLARETTLDEIRRIRELTDAEIEIFVHGALCISYSGRCLLSRYLSGRDANQGDCSHPCRWRYALVEEKRPGSFMQIDEYARGTEILSSKDLCLLEKVPEYIDAGVDAFKIEGRMKSLYYTANTTRIYKQAVKTYTRGGDYAKLLPLWQEELDLVSHRPYTHDLFNEFESEFTPLSYVKKVLFLGYKISDGSSDSTIQVKTFNPIYTEERLEAIFPIEDAVKDDTVTVLEIDDNGEKVSMAQPGKVYHITFDKPVADHAIFRRRLEERV